MHREVSDNQVAWQTASAKYVREHADLLRQAREEPLLTEVERRLLDPLLASAPAVVHLQSGHGLDDVALIAAGARSVVGVDYSEVAAGSARQRAVELGLPVA